MPGSSVHSLSLLVSDSLYAFKVLFFDLINMTRIETAAALSIFFPLFSHSDSETTAAQSAMEIISVLLSNMI